MPGSFLRIRPIAPIDFVNSWRKTMCRRNTARKSFSHWIRQIFIQDASYHREYFFVFQAVASCCHALCQKELFFPRSSPGALHRSMVQNLVTTLPREKPRARRWCYSWWRPIPPLTDQAYCKARGVRIFYWKWTLEPRPQPAPPLPHCQTVISK